MNRTEHDTMGTIEVQADRYWGAQTQRSIQNFPIGVAGSMPIEIIHAFGYLKKAAAMTNAKLGALNQEKADLIARACDEIISGELDDHFPLVIWQTGSGTQSNMNSNEVIANRCHVLAGNTLGEGERTIHPNDDVNQSQSSNDTFPTAMHIAAYKTLVEKTIPEISRLKDTLEAKSRDMCKVVKIGRTHWMDATPLTLGQEFSGYVAQIDYGLRALKNTLPHLSELALGGTAVGTGLNAPEGYAASVASDIAELTGLPFVSAPNKFESLAAHDAIVESHGALKQLAVVLTKVANDIRLLASGPRSGIGELLIPANEPGSSIMPGKVNPTQCEALAMVCTQVIGLDAAVAAAGAGGQLQMNVYKPLIGANLLQGINLLNDSCRCFRLNLVEGMEPDRDKITAFVDRSLMLVTALTPEIGYELSSAIAQHAHQEGLSLREAAIELGHITAERFDALMNPAVMARPRT